MEDIKNKIAEANEKLDEIEKILENINSINKISDTNFENKLYAFITLCKSRINNQYAILVSPSIIQNIINNLNNICQQLRKYNAAQNNNDAIQQNTEIANISSYISNNILSFINAVPFVGKGDNAKIINNLVDKLEKNSTRIINELNGNAENCQNKINDIKTKLDMRNTEINNLSSRFQAQFAESQKDRLLKFNEQLEEFESKVKKHNEEYQKLLEDNEKDYIDKTTSSKQNIENIEKEINKLYGIVADKSLVGSQAKYADQSKKFANTLFWTAFALMIFVAWIIVVPIFWALYKNPSAIDWKLILYKIPISFTILIPAFYAANESKKQRDRENLYRELEIKMCAIKPYFNDIGNGVCEQNLIQEKDRIKLKLAEKLLSPRELKNDDNIVIPKEVVDIIKEVLKVCPTSKK